MDYLPTSSLTRRHNMKTKANLLRKILFPKDCQQSNFNLRLSCQKQQNMMDQRGTTRLTILNKHSLNITLRHRTKGF